MNIPFRSGVIALSLAVPLFGCTPDNAPNQTTRDASLKAADTPVSASQTSTSTANSNNSNNSKDVEWASHGLTADEQRYSPLNQISDKTVKDLGLSWSFDMYTHRGVETTPLMVNRTIYVTSAWSVVYALDAVTGKKKWFYDPHVDRSLLAKNCCDVVNRGIAYHDGKIFVGAFDAITGDERWSYNVQTGAMAPTITYKIDGEQYIAVAAGFGDGFATERGHGQL